MHKVKEKFDFFFSPFIVSRPEKHPKQSLLYILTVVLMSSLLTTPFKGGSSITLQDKFVLKKRQHIISINHIPLQKCPVVFPMVTEVTTQSTT